MCTSVFIKTKDNKHILGRTMDFTFPLDPNPLFIPRNHKWTSAVEDTVFTTDYGFLGAGRLLGDAYFVADAVNEHGLSVAELYLPGNAVYQATPVEGKTNMAPHEFILWLLGNCESIADVESKLAAINLVEKAVPVLNFVTPLHWILSDTTGRCVVIEPTGPELKTQENPVGVMTNSPEFDWHVQNLRNYIDVQPEQFAPETFGSFVATAFSQGTGTRGLPGGYTPPERFVRATFFRQNIEPAANEIAGVSNIYHILATVRIPKGIVLTPEKQSDYSLYVGTMCNESRTYYFNDYDNNQIAKVALTDELLATTEPVIFEADAIETMKDLQANA